MKRQDLFFDPSDLIEGLASSASTALGISGQRLAPEKKLFNQLLAKIEKSKEALRNLTHLMDEHRTQYAKRLLPLEKQRWVLQTQMVLFLDLRLQNSKGLSKPVRVYMAEVLCSVAAGLFNSPEGEQMRSVYERHAYPDELGSESDAALEMADAMQDMMSQVFGIDLEGDEQLQSPEQVMAAALRKMQEQQAARQAKRKKTPKQKLAERDTMDADKVLRDIYRKLASALHPDREPDEKERQRKTALMVQVNVANEKKDLLVLLQLQLKVEQIDPDAVSVMAEDKLRHFNNVLKEQATSLKRELSQAEQMFRSEFGLSYGAITPRSLDLALRHQLREHEAFIGQMKDDIAQVQDDKGLKSWVKTQKSLTDEDDEFDELELMSLLAAKAGRR